MPPELLTPTAGRRVRARPSRRCRSPTARSRGRSAATPTSGTTSRPRWPCSSPAGTTRSTAPGRGYAAPSAHDGSWPMKIVGGVVEDASGETNMAAYVAVGVWHHWLVRRDARVRRGPLADGPGAPSTSSASLQLPFGGIAWSQEWHGGRPATRQRATACSPGSSSIHHALRAGLTLAELLDDPQPDWELAAGRLGHALREHRDRFLDKSTFSMDWYYPVLGGAVRGDAGRALLDEPLARLRGARASGCAASTPTPGSPAPSPASWRWRSTRSATATGRDAAVRGRPAPAQRRRRLLDRLRLPRRRALAGRAHDVHHRGRAARRTTRSPGRRPGADLVRGRGAGARPGAARRSSAAARQPTRSPATPDLRRSTRSDPTASTSTKAPEPSARR